MPSHREAPRAIPGSAQGGNAQAAEAKGRSRRGSKRRRQDVLHRSTLWAGGAILLLAFFAPGTALATVKCQCNNGAITQAMSVDYDDDNLDAACNDACSMLGGGRVWNVDTDQVDDDDATTGRRERRQQTPASPRR
jgi:hypothetical protein